MSEILASSAILGVKFVQLRVFEDERGRFMETFRQAWFPERPWDIVQANRSDSHAGVLRGLHYHHCQVDFWHVAHGAIRVGLADLRRSSPTRGAVQVFEIGDGNLVGVFIPVGVAHGFYALTDATLTYIVDNYYDGADECGVAWDDPDLAVPWQAIAPSLSLRDRANPRLRDIPESHLPA